MKYLLRASVVALTLASAGPLTTTATALAKPPTARHFGVYRYVYRHASRKLGAKAVGCELEYTCRSHFVTDSEVQKSTHILLYMIHPPQRFHWIAHDPPTSPYGNWAIPSAIVGCESSYQNLPPNSADASGYYQILGSTWRLNGGGPPYEAYEHSKSEQDGIASKIWDGGRGSDQWVCKA